MTAWTGVDGRECGEHRTTGGRAWCYADSEWCYPEVPCRGCEIVQLRKDSELLRHVRAVAKEAELGYFWRLVDSMLSLEMANPERNFNVDHLARLIDLLKEEK